jgi:SAM-dependent methyltransferase
MNITTIQTGFEQLHEHVKTKFDAVFCLGNTLPHLLPDDALLQSLTNFKHILQSDGTLILQVLNYDRIMKNRDRIQNIKEREGTIYIRFYDFLKETIAFNILTIKRTDDKFVHRLQTTELRPLQSLELTRFLQQAGFTDIQLFGTLNQTPYDVNVSNDLVVYAK